VKVILLNPPKFLQVWAGVPDVFNDQAAHIYPPMGIMQLSGYLKARSKHKVATMDAAAVLWTYEETALRIAAEKPDVVGITTSTHGVLSVTTMAREIKKALAGVRIVVGGPHPSAFPEHVMAIPELDFAVRGDGEEPLRLLLDRLEEGGLPEGIPGIIWRENGCIRDNGPAEPVEDLDSLPLPDREGLPIERYYTPSNAYRRTSTIMGSRGCPNQCVFCDVPHKFRARSPKHIVDEMQECSERYGIEEIHFIDDLFNSSARRVIEISEEILRRNVKMKWGFKASCRQVTPEMLQIAKRAGCYRLHYGVETHSDEGLKALNKNMTLDRIYEVFRMTKQAGLVAIAYMMIGCPHEKSPEDVLKVIPFLRRLSPDYVVYSLFTPYPDTKVFQEGAQKGLWNKNVWVDFMRDPKPGARLPTMWTEFMNGDALLQLFKQVNRAFYFSPRVLLRTVRNLRSPTHVARIMRGGWSIIKLQFVRTDSRRI
jgi:anaerobic magnesium-protoporphyrin IX monomethyl ester cyclase